MLLTATSEQQFDAIIADNANRVIVLDFWASWAEQCAQMNTVFETLASKFADLVFVKIEAEKLAEVTASFDVEAVPTFLFVKNGSVLDRVDGAHPSKLGQLAEQHTTAQPHALEQEPLDVRLHTLINQSPVMIFIKGTPQEPRCGFSRKLMALLDENSISYGYFDILSDEQVRQGLKTYSDWPTYPQVYVRGQLQGGLDIVRELVETGEFSKTVHT